MKVFMVVYESYDNSTSCFNNIEYVTSDFDNIVDVVLYYSKFCEEIEAELKEVKEIITITQHIEKEER